MVAIFSQRNLNMARTVTLLTLRKSLIDFLVQRGPP